MPLKPDLAQEVRSMVREVLRDVMSSRAQPVGPTVETVRLASDSELATFVARVIEPATLARIKAGQLRFTMGAGSSASLPQSPAEVLTGVITEQKLGQLAGTGKIVLAADAVLTPLARDKARRLGLKIERRR